MNSYPVPLILLLVLSAVLSTQTAAETLKISGDGKSPIRIVCPKDKDSREMATYLKTWLTDRGFAVRGDFGGSVKREYTGPQWVLATISTLGAVGPGIAPPRFAANSRDEAFLLDSRRGAKGATVLLVGKTGSGLRSGVGRLISRIANHGSRLTMEGGREVNDPFIKMRMVIVGAAGRRQCPDGSPFKDIDFETWSLERLRAYPRMFWQFGFNTIEFGENGGYGSLRGERLERTRQHALALAKGTRDARMYTSFSTWGDCPYDEGATYCWNDPKERLGLTEYIESMGGIYGKYIDHLNVHIGDPGGCTRNGCEPYKTPQQITNAYLQVFRKYNPKVMASLSTWANSAFWLHSPAPVDMSNYIEAFQMPANPSFGRPIPDGAKFLDETFMPKDVGIMQHQTYNDAQADLLMKAGRPVDVWAWYIGDMEMQDNIIIAMSRVDWAYKKLPDSARDKIRINSCEITFQGWPQIINQYCAAQLMWNPRKSLQAIEREFCVAGFGPGNADAMVALYRACENGPGQQIPRPAGFGTAEHNSKLRAVLERSKSIRLPAKWKPNFAFPVPAQKLVDMLVARLRLTLAVSEAKEEVDSMRAKLGETGKPGADSDAIRKIKDSAIRSLPNLPIDPLYRQDETIVNAPFRASTFAEAIELL